MTNPSPPVPPIADIGEGIISRFWAKVDRRGDDECWPWLGALSYKGYGRVFIDSKSHKPAHRFAYELENGPVSPDLVMDHLCRNRACCNPRHVEPVTTRTNVLRGVGLTAKAAAQTHCKRGHLLSGHNLLPNPKARECRECKLERNRADYRRAQDALHANG